MPWPPALQKLRVQTGAGTCVDNEKMQYYAILCLCVWKRQAQPTAMGLEKPCHQLTFQALADVGMAARVRPSSCCHVRWPGGSMDGHGYEPESYNITSLFFHRIWRRDVRFFQWDIINTFLSTVWKCSVAHTSQQHLKPPHHSPLW